MLVVFGGRSSASHLPDWHAAVMNLAGPTPPPADTGGSPDGDAISSFASSVDDPISSSLSAEVRRAELQAFAKANKAQLRTLGVDTSKLARKDLMPALVQTFSEKPAS